MSAAIALPESHSDDPIHPGAPDIPQASDMVIPDVLQKGTLMTKVSERAKKRVVFRIDPDEGQILYKSSKGGIIPIETIKEIRSGSDAHYYRSQFQLAEETEDRWITVIYILDGTYKTLHMVADTRDVFKLWDTSLRKLYAIRQGLMSGSGNVGLRQSVWERQYWKGADKAGDQILDFEDIERLCKRLNVNLTTAELEKLFKDADTTNRGYLNFPEFQRFVKVLKHRPDIEAIYQKVSSNSGGKFDFSAFEKFMRDTQKSKLSQDGLKSVFAKYTPEQPATDTPTTSPNEESEFMTIDGFTDFLISPDNAAFSEQNESIWQDMTRPISEYFISTSHNTYLVGNQLVGVSTIEGYIRALLHSCRSVELDIYDGDKEPVVYHGKTLTSKVSLRDICEAIAKYAFVTSPYPVLISAEVHCGVAQQDLLVDIMNKTFGEDLIQAPIEGRPKLEFLPSPEDLRLKFLLKAKNLYVVQQLAAAQAHSKAATKSPLLMSLPKPSFFEADPPSSTSASSDEPEEKIIKEGITEIKEGITEMKKTWRKIRGKHNSIPKPKVKMSFRLAALLVYTVGVKCHGLAPETTYAPEHIFSLSENSATKLLKESTAELIQHTQKHLVRIYPKGTRVNSTNYQPHRYWASGAQLAAINWQTFDLGYMINQAMFQRNGRAGYVLKPDALRLSDKGLLSKRTQHFFDVTIISAQQLPRLRNSSGQELIEKSIIDPFVEVSLHIPDWSHSPFLPDSAKEAGNKYKYTPPTDATSTKATSGRTVSFRTRPIKDNGFNPEWQEELCLPFDCIGDMKDLIFVEFAVRQHGKDEGEPLGMYCVSLGSLEHGFRHLPLHDAQMSQHLFSTLFVQINIRDVD